MTNRSGSNHQRAQSTISKPVTISGTGYWSGLDINLELRPASIDTGIEFIRRDFATPVRIPARVGNRVDMQRRTTLAKDDFSVDMIEHLMAAFAGLRIDNCEVWIDRAEMPGLDGSAKPFCDALLAAGRVEQQALRPILRVNEPIRIENGKSWIQATPYDGYAVEYQLDYAHPAIGKQTLALEINPESFYDQLASCRTFMLQSEAELLQAQGLGTHVSHKDLLVIGDEGPLDNELRFDNEYARHKALDLVGDLALAPFDIQAKITAHRSGHRMNAAMAKELLAQAEIVRFERRSA